MSRLARSALASPLVAGVIISSAACTGSPDTSPSSPDTAAIDISRNAVVGTYSNATTDTNTHGAQDAAAVDTNGDGVLDTVAVDTNSDGVLDTAVGDTNSDGALDILAIDQNNDGYLETVAVDTNIDGVLDTAGIDANGDGVLDDTTPLSDGVRPSGPTGSESSSTTSSDWVSNYMVDEAVENAFEAQQDFARSLGSTTGDWAGY